MMLTGHTDSTGNDDYNMQLSQRRVDEVYDWLMEKDVDTSVVGRVYFGRSKPREKNEGDEEKKSKNRRVEITIIEKPAPPPPPPPPPPKDTCVKDTTVSACAEKILKDASPLIAKPNWMKFLKVEPHLEP
jgi:hypothetical protein